MPTACMHTRLHGPQGCTSVSYTTSWFGSPEVNKLVVWAGLHTLTTGKYLIGPGNTQHQGCDQPALWSTRTKRRSGRERRRTIEWPQISLQCHFIPPLLSQVQQGLDSGDTQRHPMFPLRCSPPVPLYLLLRSCSHHSPAPPGSRKEPQSTQRNVTDPTGKRVQPFWPSGTTSGSL